MLFFQANMIFLGHILSADGISVNPEKDEKGITFIPQYGILLLPVHSKLHSHGQVFAPIDRSSQYQED